MLSPMIRSSIRQPTLMVRSSNFSSASRLFADPGRQSAADKAKSAITPESEKSVAQKGKDALDSAASTLQPNESKSTTQKATDALSGNSNENSDSLLDKAKNVLGLDKEKK